MASSSDWVRALDESRARLEPLPTARAAASEEGPQEPATAERSPQRRPPRRSRPRPRRAPAAATPGAGQQRPRSDGTETGWQLTCGSGSAAGTSSTLSTTVAATCVGSSVGAARGVAALGAAYGVRGGRHNASAWTAQASDRAPQRAQASSRRTRPLRRTRRCRPDGTNPDARRLRRTAFGFAAAGAAAGSASPATAAATAARPAACGTGTATLAPAIVSTAAPSAPAARGVSVRDLDPRPQPDEPAGQRRQEDRPTRHGRRIELVAQRAARPEEQHLNRGDRRVELRGDLDVGEPDDLAEHERRVAAPAAEPRAPRRAHGTARAADRR